MELHRGGENVKIIHSDALYALRAMPECSVDAVFTDPPYGLTDIPLEKYVAAVTHWIGDDREWVPRGRGFMGRAWDRFVPPPAIWDEAMRVLKPGGQMLVFASARTMGLMDTSIRLAGFEIRDVIAWINGQNMPKGQDVSKMVDAHIVHGKSNSAGLRATNESRPGEATYGTGLPSNGIMSDSISEARPSRDDPQTPEGAEWIGWKTQLKGAFEPMILARKPLEGTHAENVLKYGTGALNVDAGRIRRKEGDRTEYGRDNLLDYAHESVALGRFNQNTPYVPDEGGRFPSNVILDDVTAAEMDRQAGASRSTKGKPRKSAKPREGWGSTHTGTEYDDEGGRSRFFYAAKADKTERPVGPDGFKHSTVKPLSIVRYAMPLIVPPGGVVIDPFAGSGTTGEVAIELGYDCILIEQDERCLPLIDTRLARAMAREPSQPKLLRDSDLPGAMLDFRA